VVLTEQPVIVGVEDFFLQDLVECLVKV